MNTKKLLGFALLGFAVWKYSQPPRRIVPPPRPPGSYQNNYAQWLAYAQNIIAQAKQLYGSGQQVYQALFGPGGVFYKEPLPTYDAGSQFWQDAGASGLAGVGAIYREIPSFFQCTDGTFSTSTSTRACRRHGGKKSDLPYQLTSGAGSNLLNIQDVPLSQIHVNHALFQGREKAYSPRSVENILAAVANGAFLWENLDPVVLWQSPDGKKYLVSGHSRTEAFRRLEAAGATAGGKGFSRIPAKVLQNVSKEVAKTVALESNTLSTKENDVERAAYYRRLRQDGRGEKQIFEAVKKNEGRNANNIYAYTFLSPSGKAWYNLKQFAEDESQSGQITKALAAWIGNARKIFPVLTNDHENELTTWLFEKRGYGTGAGQVNNAREFSESVQKFVARNTFLGVFDPTKPLNIEGLLTKTPTEMEYDLQIEAAKKAAAEADKLWKAKADELTGRKASQTDVQRILLPYSTNRQNAYLNLKRLMENKSRVMEYAKNEPALFGIRRRRYATL
jgi:hypothetical protein